MAISTEEAKQWPKQDKRRFLHAVYRVGDLDATIDYYKTHFGMKQLRYRDVPDVSLKTNSVLHAAVMPQAYNCCEAWFFL